MSARLPRGTADDSGMESDVVTEEHLDDMQIDEPGREEEMDEGHQEEEEQITNDVIFKTVSELLKKEEAAMKMYPLTDRRGRKRSRKEMEAPAKPQFARREKKERKVKKVHESHAYHSHSGELYVNDSATFLCDCLDKECMGCHSSCKHCRGRRCGPVCQSSRDRYCAKVVTIGHEPVHNPLVLNVPKP